MFDRDFSHIILNYYSYMSFLFCVPVSVILKRLVLYSCNFDRFKVMPKMPL